MVVRPTSEPFSTKYSILTCNPAAAAALIGSHKADGLGAGGAFADKCAAKFGQPLGGLLYGYVASTIIVYVDDYPSADRLRFQPRGTFSQSFRNSIHVRELRVVGVYARMQSRQVTLKTAPPDQLDSALLFDYEADYDVDLGNAAGIKTTRSISTRPTSRNAGASRVTSSPSFG